MPIMKGYEATRQLRMEERQYGLRTPIIALTAHAMAEEANKSIQAGMDFQLVKPSTTKELLEVIDSINNNNRKKWPTNKWLSGNGTSVSCKAYGCILGMSCPM